MTKLSLTILISLMATLLISSPALGAKEKFERTKPHVNVGAQSRSSSFDSQDIYTAIPHGLLTVDPSQKLAYLQQSNDVPINQRYRGYYKTPGMVLTKATPSVPSRRWDSNFQYHDTFVQLPYQSRQVPVSGPNNRVVGESLKMYPASAVVRPGRDSFYQVSFERGTEPTPKFHSTYTPIPKNPTGSEHRKGQATRMSLVVSIDLEEATDLRPIYDFIAGPFAPPDQELSPDSRVLSGTSGSGSLYQHRTRLSSESPWRDSLTQSHHPHATPVDCSADGC